MTALKRLKLRDTELQASLCYIVRQCLIEEEKVPQLSIKWNKYNKRFYWLSLVARTFNPDIQETEAGRS